MGGDYIRCSQQFRGRPGMPMEISCPVNNRTVCGMNPDILLPVEKKFDSSIMVSGDNINMCMFCKCFEEARNFVFLLLGDLRNIMFHVSKKYYSIRGICLDIAKKPVQPPFHLAGQIDPAPVQVPLDPKVDVGNYE